ncbi:MAG: glycosyltransferase family 9 protein [Candidatus Omnitrophica bacterium]|nr:glycosyltransferase family 9 protein [Candidatus Omnitrophota bacterium]
MNSRLDREQVKKILVINLGGIGDFLLSTPALRALARGYPSAQVSVLISPGIAELAAGLPYINTVYPFAVQYGKIPLGKMFGNFMLLLRLRRQGFDMAVNMRTLVSEKSSRKIKFLLQCIHPGISVGRDTEGRGDFFGIKIPETDKGRKYEMDYDIDTVAAVGAVGHDRKIDLVVPEQCRRKLSGLLKEHGVGERDVLIGMHPGGMESRRWPINNFAQVIDALQKKIPCKIVITGAGNETVLAESLVDRTAPGAVINLCGRLTFGDLTALIERCHVFVSNDTGPMHIAAVLKTPLVAIFGPGDLVRFDPRNLSDKAVVVYTPTECAPCNRRHCDLMRCFERVTSEKVINAVEGLLKEREKQ